MHRINNIKRTIYVIIGLISFGLVAVGVMIPVLPTCMIIIFYYFKFFIKTISQEEKDYKNSLKEVG